MGANLVNVVIYFSKIKMLFYGFLCLFTVFIQSDMHTVSFTNFYNYSCSKIKGNITMRMGENSFSYKFSTRHDANVIPMQDTILQTNFN